MSIKSFPVAYFDESGIWNSFSNFILERLPLLGVKLKTVEGEILLPPLPVEFVPHDNSFLQSTPEDRYLNPYLWIFVLKYSNYDNFKRDTKVKLNQLINIMQNKGIEWLVLFVPSLNNLVKSDHKNFATNYEKLQSELVSMFGKKNISRFYCNSNKTFLDLNLPSAIKEAYWQDFIQAIGNGISIGIQTAINMHLMYSQATILESPAKYCLNQEALALIYNLSGLRLQACYFYDLISNTLLDNNFFCKGSLDELDPDFCIETNEFRTKILTNQISALNFYRYIFEQEKNILKQDKKFERISEITVKFLGKLKNIFASDLSKEFETLNDYYIYKIGTSLYEEILENLEGIKKVDLSADSKLFCYFNFAKIINYVKNALFVEASKLNRIDFRTRDKFLIVDSGEIQIDPSQNLEDSDNYNQNIENDCTKRLSEDFLENISNKEKALKRLLHFDRKIFEYFSLSDYTRTGLHFKSESCIFAFQLQNYQIIPEILNQLSYWESIDSIHFNFQYFCNSFLQNHAEALKNLIDICNLSYFSSEKLEKMWKKIENLSITYPAHGNFSNIRAYGCIKTKVMQGEIISLMVILESKLKVSVKFQKIVAKFIGGESSVKLESNGVYLIPGKNCVKLIGFVGVPGKLKLDSITGIFNKVMCVFSNSPMFLIVKDNEQSLNVRVKSPEIVVKGKDFTVLIEIVNNKEEILDSSVKILNFEDILNVDLQAESVDFVKNSEKIEIRDGVLKIDYIPKQSITYIILKFTKNQIVDPYFQVFFNFSCTEKSIERFIEFNFAIPFIINASLVKMSENLYILSVRMENSLEERIKILKISLENCKIIEDLQVFPYVIDPNQILHLIYLVESFENCRFLVQFKKDKEISIENTFISRLKDFPLINSRFLFDFEISFREVLTENLIIDEGLQILGENVKLYEKSIGNEVLFNKSVKFSKDESGLESDKFMKDFEIYSEADNFSARNISERFLDDTDEVDLEKSG